MTTRQKTERQEMEQLIYDVVSSVLQSNETKDTLVDIVRGTQEPLPLSLGGETDLKPFSGTIGENFEDWIKHFERLAQANRWEDDRKRDVLPFYLRGGAETIYDEIPQDNRRTYNNLINELRAKLRPSQLSDLRSVELHSRSQGPRESVAEYSQAIAKLTKQAYPEVTADVRKQLMKRFF